MAGLNIKCLVIDEAHVKGVSPMYVSPITIMQGELNVQVENEVIKATRTVGVDVDKDELIKALMYDREQYEKGYADGRADAEMQLLELENMDEVVKELNVFLLKNKLTIKGMSGEKLILTDQVTGEEYVVQDLGYPF